MATTIPAAFTQFKSNLEVTDLQSETISIRHQNVRAAVAKDFEVLSDCLTGSYIRSTMIAPLKQADIDIFIVLNSKYFEQSGQAKLLDSIKATLKKKYPLSPSISRNGQAVTITFTDFKVDVVPAFHRQGGGYLIPDTRGKRWIPTDPKEHVKISAAANKAHRGELVPLIKMIKQWNRKISFPFQSFHLEVLAWDILDNVTITDLPSGMRYFLDKGRTIVTKQNPDPTGYNADVGSYITQSDVKTAANNFETAYQRAIKAEQYAFDGQTELAIVEWHKIFGTTRFPAYG